jgi:hypothetical protein
MKSLRVILVALAVLLAVTATATLTLAQGPKGTGEITAPLASAGTAFTYQGQLKNDAGSVNATCDFQFGLWDALTVGVQVGVTQTKSAVSVTGGLFTTSIDFGIDSFTGGARWLDIQVACPAGSAYARLTPRQALTPAPYALGLAPGAHISGTASTALAGISSAWQGTGIYGEADSGPNAWGLGGFSSSGIGVFASGGNNVGAPNTALTIYGGKLAVGGSLKPAFVFTASNVSGGSSAMSSPLFNGDPNAMIFVTPRQTSVVPARDVQVSYSSGIWYLYSPTLANGMTYNVLVINQ